MPSFALLKDEELEGLASYVMHLSIRGEVEKNVITSMANGEDFSPWTRCIEHNASARHGRRPVGGGRRQIHRAGQGFLQRPDHQTAGGIDPPRLQTLLRPGGRPPCTASAGHQDYGRQVPFRYDLWGTLVRPANLTLGVYRGGRRPVDFFWRIRKGIAPSGMPPTGVQDDKEVWAVVHFVQAMPYPQMLPEDVRYKIFDRPPGAQANEAERVEK